MQMLRYISGITRKGYNQGRIHKRKLWGIAPVEEKIKEFHLRWLRHPHKDPKQHWNDVFKGYKFKELEGQTIKELESSEELECKCQLEKT